MNGHSDAFPPVVSHTTQEGATPKSAALPSPKNEGEGAVKLTVETTAHPLEVLLQGGLTVKHTQGFQEIWQKVQPVSYPSDHTGLTLLPKRIGVTLHCQRHRDYDPAKGHLSGYMSETEEDIVRLAAMGGPGPKWPYKLRYRDEGTGKEAVGVMRSNLPDGKWPFPEGYDGVCCIGGTYFDGSDYPVYDFCPHITAVRTPSGVPSEVPNHSI